MSPIVVRYGVGIAVAVALTAAAASKDDEKTSVKVSVIAILASDKKDNIDPKLSCIAREVRKTHKELKGFRLTKLTSKSLAIGVPATFDLVGDQKVAVTVTRGA
ncbi:MAG: hypothetical protein ACRELF_29095, partial [Gemmataceae bacterium]